MIPVSPPFSYELIQASVLRASYFVPFAPLFRPHSRIFRTVSSAVLFYCHSLLSEITIVRFRFIYLSNIGCIPCPFRGVADALQVVAPYVAHGSCDGFQRSQECGSALFFYFLSSFVVLFVISFLLTHLRS